MCKSARDVTSRCTSVCVFPTFSVEFFDTFFLFWRRTLVCQWCILIWCWLKRDRGQRKKLRVWNMCSCYFHNSALSHSCTENRWSFFLFSIVIWVSFAKTTLRERSLWNLKWAAFIQVCTWHDDENALLPLLFFVRCMFFFLLSPAFALVRSTAAPEGACLDARVFLFPGVLCRPFSFLVLRERRVSRFSKFGVGNATEVRVVLYSFSWFSSAFAGRLLAHQACSG